MKKSIFLSLLVPLAAVAVEVDGIAAKVGTESILRSDVMREMERFGERDESRYTEFLEQLINRKLMLKAAGDAKMSVQEWMVESRNRELINSAFGGDRNRLLEMLSKQKVSYPEWYARRKEDMTIDAMRWVVVSKYVTASPADMKKMFAEHPERYVAKHKVSLSAVYIPSGETARREEVGSKFGKVAVEALGGNKYVDIDPREMFTPEICAAIDKLAVGATSGWLDLGNGYELIIRKDAEREGRQMSFADAYDKVEADVKEAAAKKAEQAWINRLRAETYIKVF